MNVKRVAARVDDHDVEDSQVTGFAFDKAADARWIGEPCMTKAEVYKQDPNRKFWKNKM